MIVGSGQEVSAGVLLITADEVATMLNVSVRSIWRLNSAYLIPAPVRFGGAVRWRSDEVRKWIAEGCPPPQSRENGSRRK